MSKILIHLGATKKVFIACLIAFSLIYIYTVLPTPDRILDVETPHDEQQYLDRFQTWLNFSEIAKNLDSLFIDPVPTCPKSIVRLYIIVCSSAQNFLERQAIRTSWGRASNYNGSVQVQFIVGMSQESLIDNFIEIEKQKFGDIIHYNLTDTYFNLTLKSFVLLHWIHKICNRCHFIMKTDDDTFVNVPLLLHELKSKRYDQNLLFGHVMARARPLRDSSSKWYVPKMVYSRTYYPNYLSGSGYVISAHTVPLIYKFAMKITFFYLEDIFITGMCAETAGLKPLHHEAFTYKKQSLDHCNLRNVITAHRLRPIEQTGAWKNLQTLKQCRVRRESQRFFKNLFNTVLFS